MKTRTSIGKILAVLTAWLWFALLPLAPTVAQDGLARAEAWFNAVTTIKADFTQDSSDGSEASGKFYLRRPYFSRFDYDEPTPLILITTEAWIHVDETDQRLLTSYPVDETPLGKILTDPVRLTSGEFETTARTVNDILRVTLQTKDGSAAGHLVLDFAQDPMELLAWHVIDANGIRTSVRLSNIVRGEPVANRLFVPNTYENEN